MRLQLERQWVRAGGRSLAQMILGRDPDIDLSYFQWPRRSDVVRRPAMVFENHLLAQMPTLMPSTYRFFKVIG